jgi:hypothetical protein
MNALRQTLIFVIGLAITLASPLALAATTFTDGAWKLVRSGTVLPANYATAADCDSALRAVVVPVGSSVTYRCQRSTVARGVADAPVPVNCVVTAWGGWTWSAWAVTGTTETRTGTRTRTVTTPAANGGTACPTLTETTTETRPYVPPPPATVWTFAVNENNTFTLYAPAQVRFGRSASGLWLYSNHPAGVVDCSYLALGDPEPRTAKWCEVSPASALTAPPVTGTGTAITTWDAVTLDTAGQPITVTGYRVEYGRGDFAQSASVAGTSALIERLASGTWQFRVRAIAGTVESEPSNVGTKLIP